MLRKLVRTGSEGFTLIELLVVVSIIAILSFTVVTNLNSARGKARDAKITSDLSEVDKALVLYDANDDATPLPALTGKDGFTALVGDADQTTALRPKYIPAKAKVKHPLSPDFEYQFKGSKVAGVINYSLCAKLENAPASDPTKFFFIVQNGASFMAADASLCN